MVSELMGLFAILREGGFGRPRMTAVMLPTGHLSVVFEDMGEAGHAAAQIVFDPVQLTRGSKWLEEAWLYKVDEMNANIDEYNRRTGEA